MLQIKEESMTEISHAQVIRQTQLEPSDYDLSELQVALSYTEGSSAREVRESMAVGVARLANTAFSEVVGLDRDQEFAMNLDRSDAVGRLGVAQVRAQARFHRLEKIVNQLIGHGTPGDDELFSGSIPSDVETVNYGQDLGVLGRIASGDFMPAVD